LILDTLLILFVDWTSNGKHWVLSKKPNSTIP